MGADDLIIILICVLIGISRELSAPKQLAIIDEYNNVNIVQIDKKYQCPIYCDVDHIHFLYYKDKINNDDVMYIDMSKYNKPQKVFILQKK